MPVAFDGIASLASLRKASGLASATARAPPSSGPRSALPMMTPSAPNEAGTGRAANARVSHPSCRYWSAREAVSQISMERKCDRLGCGYDSPCTTELARLPQRHQRLQGRMQAIAIVELQHLLALDGDARAQRVVLRAGIRDHGVEPVIAALELDQDQQVAVPIALAPPLRKDNARQRATHAEHRTRFQKIATFHDVLRRLR